MTGRSSGQCSFDSQCRTPLINIASFFISRIQACESDFSQPETIPIREDTPIFLKKNSCFRKITEHRHSYIEIGYIYSGSVPEIVGGKTYTLRQGQMILIDRNTTIPSNIQKKMIF